MSEENEAQEDVSELRKAAAGGAAAKAERDLARKELAFVKAGIDTDSKPAQALLNSYAGELDAEAIKAEAAEWGLVQVVEAPPEADPKLEAVSEAQAQQAIRDQIEGGAPAPDTKPELGGVDQALATFIEEKEAGFSQVDATNRAIGRVIQAAARGDSQARFDRDAWERKAAEYGHGAEHAG